MKRWPRSSLRTAMHTLCVAAARGSLALYHHTGRHDRYAQRSTTEISRFMLFTEKQLRSLADLDEEIALQSNALEPRPLAEGHSARAFSLGNLANSLRTRFHQFGSLADLDESIALDRNALQLRPEGHPDRAHSLGNLAASLRTRFHQLGSLADLGEAIALHRNALELRPEGHPDRAHALGNLADSLHSRFNQLGDAIQG